ncbi:MAG: amidohydrolase family protein [Thaumarchaeota archaeon]|nr:amidohydrolase family protein [Nitrososphaerota archaeon]
MPRDRRGNRAAVAAVEPEIIDCHVHNDVYLMGGHIKGGNRKDLPAMADRLGISKMCVSSFMALHYDFVEGNNNTLRLMRELPDRVLGYCVLNPRFGDLALNELERCIVKGGMIGAKMYPVPPKWVADEPSAYPLMERLSKLRVPILIHADPVAPIFRLADRFPDATYLLAHMGGGGSDGLEGMYGCIHESKRHDNIYLDSTTSNVESNIIEEAVRVVGAERVLFGTDYPCIEPYAQLAKVKAAAVAEDERALILGGNIKRLIGRKRV